jgi:putative membrane protein insertion efficiency factor
MFLKKLITPKDNLSFKMSCRRLSVDDHNAVKDLYTKAYPGNWFDQRMLETGKYFGAFDDNVMISIAGIHVYSRLYRVAVLGNITTLAAYRDQGVASNLTAELCRDLLTDGIESIGLNVKSDNQKAIRCYQKTISPDHGLFSTLFPHGYCRFYPSCSEYGYQSIKNKGLIKGVFKTTWRILRCNPFNKIGKTGCWPV